MGISIVTAKPVPLHLFGAIPMIKTERFTIDMNTYLVVNLRFNDECSNGHDTFGITADLYDSRIKREGGLIACGCLHAEIAEHAPKYADLIKWHLCSTTGPLHYLDNTLYWVGAENLDYARSSAIWPDASIDQLGDVELLIDRKPYLMVEFNEAMASTFTA